MKKFCRIALLCWELFIGIGAVGGATSMLLDPTGKLLGMDALLPYFQVLPFADVLFQDLIFPGISLLIVNGLSQLFAAFLLAKKHRMGAAAGFVCGIVLMLWITIQFIILPSNVLSTLYFIFGGLEALTAAGWMHYTRKEAAIQAGARA